MATAAEARTAAARIINDTAYSDRFRVRPNKLFPKGQVSFLPGFAEEPNAQAAQGGPSPSGHELATLWLAAAPGDEPDLDPEPEPNDPLEPDPPQPTPDDPPPPQPERDFVDWEDLHR